ncbi:hypothetical protein VDGE_30493 [Verticillium dahliae]|uniref:Uncharacterized protein n=1 Tax=Verticillium dahliae TaxID=27337 RepID=A0A444RS47_VERDA|nr:hypothetical protein VDGE_30493 [Verticillium dahliae]
MGVLPFQQQVPVQSSTYLVEASEQLVSDTYIIISRPPPSIPPFILIPAIALDSRLASHSWTFFNNFTHAPLAGASILVC